MPVHTLGLTVALTGTHSHFRASEEAKCKLERNGQRNSVRSKTEKKMGHGEEARLALLNL